MTCRCIYRGEGEVVSCEGCILRRRAEENARPSAPELASRRLHSVLVVRVEGPPRGKERPRFGGAGRRPVTAGQTREWEERARYFARREAGTNRWAFQASDRFDVDVLACFASGVRPDLDNVAKACLDALNGVAYPDDRKVEAISIRSGGTVPTPYVLITVRRFVLGSP